MLDSNRFVRSILNHTDSVTTNTVGRLKSTNDGVMVNNKISDANTSIK